MATPATVAERLDADDAVADDVKADLLALYHTFAHEDRLSYAHGKDEEGDSSIRITFDASPRADSRRTHDVYVKATIALDVRNDGTYPASSAVRARVTHERGLSDARARALTSTLADVAERCRASREYALTLMCTTAREVMDAYDAPHGTCALCCDDMAGAREACGKVDACWHAFHAECFSRWYAWREREIDGELARARTHPRGSDEAKEIEARAVHACPVCRAVVSREDAERFKARAAAVRDEDPSLSLSSSLSSSSLSLSRVLDSDARAMLEKLRVEFRDGLRVQDGKGGVIDERASGVGVVIDQSTTFTRSTTSAPSTAEGAVVAPPPLRSNNAATAVRRPRKDSSWLSRAAARSTKTPEPSEGGARAPTQKSSTSGATPRGRGRGRSEGKTATVVPRPQGP